MKVQLITRTAVLMAITLTIQALGLPPQFSGPAFNAMLLLSTVFVGPAAGILIGILAPWVALTREILSPVLAPAVPFFIVGNVAYVWAFAHLCPLAGRYLALFAGAVAKFFVLAVAANFLLRIPNPLAASLGVPELFAALMGGAVALVIAQLLTAVFGEPELQVGKRVGNHEN